MAEDNQRISPDQAVEEALADVFQAALLGGVKLASSKLFTGAHYRPVASRVPHGCCLTSEGSLLCLSSLTPCPLLLHPEFLRPPSGFHPGLRSPGPPTAPDHLPAGGAWHQRPLQADHRGPGGHRSSWLTGSSLPGNVDEV